MDRFTAETECDPHFWYDLQNMDCDEGGKTQKRRGSYTTGLTLSGAINMIYDHQSQQSFGTPGDNQRTLIVSGAVLNIVKGFNTAGQTIEATFSTTNARHYAITDDVGAAYIGNESGGPIKLLTLIGSTWSFQDANLAAPTGSFSITAGGSVSFTVSGTFQAQYSYVDIWGNESPLSVESNEVVISNTSVDVTFTQSSDPTVNYLKFYLLGPGMTDFQFSGTASITSGTYSHSMTMAELMAGDLAPDYLVPFPQGKYVTLYEDMLLVGGDLVVPDTVWCSNRQFHRQWSDNFARCVSGDGQPIRGFGDGFDRKSVLKADSIFLCEGYDSETFRTHAYSKQYGAVGQCAISQADNLLAFFYDDGLYVDNGQKPDEVSRKILNYLRTLDWRNIVPIGGEPSKLVLATYKYFRQLMVSTKIGSTISGENDVMLVWNYLMNTWTRYTGNAPSCIAPVQNADDYEYLFGGDANGHTWIFSPPNSAFRNDDKVGSSTQSTTISCIAETPWMNLAKLKGMDDWETNTHHPEICGDIRFRRTCGRAR